MKNSQLFSGTVAKFAFLMLFMAISTYSQDATYGTGFWNRVRFGGGIGLGFGRDTFNAQLAPSAIYQVNHYFATGLGLNFNYARFGDARLTAYGGSILTLFNPITPIQLSAELEQLRVHRDFGTGLPGDKDSYWLPALFAGLGYSSGNVTIGIRYDLLYNENKSIYTDPWMPFVRFYF